MGSRHGLNRSMRSLAWAVAHVTAGTPDGTITGMETMTSTEAICPTCRGTGLTEPVPDGREGSGGYRQDPCSDCCGGGAAHAWRAGGLDTDGRGVLVSTRRCVRCSTEQVKTYGGKGGWRQRR